MFFLSLAIKNIGQRYKGKEDVFEKFKNSLSLSSITTVSSNTVKVGQERAEAMKVSRIVLEGKSIEVKNPTDAIIETYQFVLQKNNSKIKEFMEKYPRILTTDENAVKGYYRKKKELKAISSDGKVLYIGTSSSSMDKMLYTKYLCDFMGMEPEQVIWYDGNEKVFSN